MKLEELQEIITLMEHSGIAELSLEEENLKLSLKREASTPVVISQPTYVPPTTISQTQPAPALSPTSTAKNIVLIKSPMVGTFYVAPSPDSAPFVSEGTVISEDTVVCILEAMKVMNEVRAECSGTIVEILAKNGAPVEYGQPLFKVQVG